MLACFAFYLYLYLRTRSGKKQKVAIGGERRGAILAARAPGLLHHCSLPNRLWVTASPIKGDARDHHKSDDAANDEQCEERSDRRWTEWRRAGWRRRIQATTVARRDEAAAAAAAALAIQADPHLVTVACANL